MQCMICRSGAYVPGLVTVTLERGTTTLVMKGVPALICENCGEAYVDEAVSEQLLGTAEVAMGAGVQVEVRTFEAA
jgi:YgiT-type zinc finger domain-containing protein